VFAIFAGEQFFNSIVHSLVERKPMFKKQLLFVLFFVAFASHASIDKAHYFGVFSGNSSDKIKSERQRLEKLTSTSETRAYLGAMIMKEAQYLSSAKEKLTHFNKGKAMLEAEIKANKSAVDYRFLRLMIQENCPKILNYHGQVKEDAALIIKDYSKQNTALKSVILSYSKSSSALPTSKLTT
jgi:hypothetical protein